MEEKIIPRENISPDEWNRPTENTDGILAMQGRILFLAGQVGWDEHEKFQSTKLVPQFEQALKNIIAIVIRAGGKVENICKLTCFCTDRDQYLASRREIREVWKTLMKNHSPCMSLIFVADLLDHPAVIEIEATAVVPTDPCVSFTITA
ncbi:MAG: RidA family protein [Bacteroidia bacterium]|nr:RidA family protein [Bacteroidia bacterium]